MPTYDYLCEKCGHEFEVFQSMNADRLTDCPQENCTGSVKRKIGAGAGFVFKGSGFYSTDYRSESYKKGAAAEKSDKKPPSDNTSKSSAKKSEPK